MAKFQGKNRLFLVVFQGKISKILANYTPKNTKIFLKLPGRILFLRKKIDLG
jgi:hypothetical protein